MFDRIVVALATEGGKPERIMIVGVDGPTASDVPI